MPLAPTIWLGGLWIILSLHTRICSIVIRHISNVRQLMRRSDMSSIVISHIINVLRLMRRNDICSIVIRHINNVLQLMHHSDIRNICIATCLPTQAESLVIAQHLEA